MLVIVDLREEKQYQIDHPDATLITTAQVNGLESGHQ